MKPHYMYDHSQMYSLSDNNFLADCDDHDNTYHQILFVMRIATVNVLC